MQGVLAGFKRQRFEQAAGLEKALIDSLAGGCSGDGTGEIRGRYIFATQPNGSRTTVTRTRCLNSCGGLVRSIAADGRGEGGSGGSMGVRGRDGETLQVTLQRDWDIVGRRLPSCGERPPGAY